MDIPRVPHVADIARVQGLDLSRWPLIGRDDELALATTVLSEQGSVVLTGAAGVGKTRLAHEALARVATERDRTEWVTATRSASTVPLGAVAHLVPEAAIGGSRNETLARIVGALRRNDGPRLFLGIDDAHLLDGASAALVHLLVVGGAASVVVTVRSGEPAPDSIASLWKEGFAQLVALQALARNEVETIVTTVLDDPVDGATLRFLWQSSQGNALFLRELVRHGVESGVFSHDEGMWRWRARLDLGERLQNLVAMRMGALDDAERTALELIAVGQPLTIDCVRRLGIADLIAPLERRGLVASQQRERVLFALAHPLFGEVLRERIPRTRMDEVHRELADAVGATSNGVPADDFRVALWRVDAGDLTRPEQIRAAAARALRLWDPLTAERLARAALDAGPDVEAVYVLGAALSDQNRANEALDAFRAARTLAGSDRIRASIAADEAGVLSHQLGRLEDAERVLTETLEQVSDRDARAVLEGGRAAIVVSSGNATARDLPEVSGATPTAALAAVIANATAGQLDLAVHIASECLATASDWTDDFATIEHFLRLTQTWALVLSGRVSDAQRRADAAYAAALDANAEFPRLTWSFVRGIIFVVRGLPRSASRALREAVGGFEAGDRGFLRPSHTYLALAVALGGDGSSAERHVRSGQDAKSSFDGLFAVDLARARAWTMAARGEVSAAAELALRAAEEAALRNAYALEVLALHDVVRFGRVGDVVDRLDALRELVDGALVDGVAAHAHALARGDGAALDAVSDAFSRLNLDLFAAEASAAAAQAHRRDGRRASAFAAAERARALAAGCEGAHSTTLQWADQGGDLTAREREVAELAAANLASRDIAERLGITTRTVDNMLGRVYLKLGLSGRQGLRALFRGPSQ